MVLSSFLWNIFASKDNEVRIRPIQLVYEKCELKRMSLASYHRTSTNYFKLIMCCSSKVSLKMEKFLH